MIRYNSEEIKFNLSQKRKNNAWLKHIIISEKSIVGDINIIFCSDDYLLRINKQFLEHDYYTDIITFDYCYDNVISGDLFISIDSVRENAILYKFTFEEELRRVMAHGILHLLKYDDHCDEDIKMMRYKENFYLAQYE